VYTNMRRIWDHADTAAREKLQAELGKGIRVTVHCSAIDAEQVMLEIPVGQRDASTPPFSMTNAHVSRLPPAAAPCRQPCRCSALGYAARR